jgi:hypothetical protein
MLNLRNFQSKISKYDVQRPNLFEVKFNIPRNLKFGGNDANVRSAVREATENGLLLTAFCRSATLPGAALGLAEARRYGIGPTVRTPVFSSSSPDVSLTFISDSGGIIRSVFTNWMRCIYEWTPEEEVGKGKNYQLGYKSDYSSTLEVIVFHGEPGKYRGSEILQTVGSVIFAAAGTPFVTSSLFGGGVASFPLRTIKKVSLYKAFPISVSEMSLSHESTNTLSEFTVNFSYYDWSDEPLDDPDFNLGIR